MIIVIIREVLICALHAKLCLLIVCVYIMFVFVNRIGCGDCAFRRPHSQNVCA